MDQASMTTTGASRFFDLPLELREQIYRLVLVSGRGMLEPTNAQTRADPPPNHLSAWTRNRTDAANKAASEDFTLLRVNKQIFDEANHVLLRDSLVKIDLNTELGFRNGSLTRRANGILSTRRYLFIILGDVMNRQVTNLPAIELLASRTNIKVVRLAITPEMGSILTNTDISRHEDDLQVFKQFSRVKMCMPSQLFILHEWPAGERGPALSRLFSEVRQELTRVCLCKKDQQGNHVEFEFV